MKKALSLVLSLMLVVGLAPSAAFAEEVAAMPGSTTEAQAGTSGVQQDSSESAGSQDQAGSPDVPGPGAQGEAAKNPAGGGLSGAPDADAADGADDGLASDRNPSDSPVETAPSVGAEATSEPGSEASDAKARSNTELGAEDEAVESEGDEVEIDPLADQGAALMDAGGRIYRLHGADALGTMTAVTRQGFANGSCDTVVVATMGGYWDALTASALAGLNQCPVLLTDGAKLSSQTATEIKRLGASKVYIAGGSAAVSKSVESSLAKIVKTVKRLEGPIAIDTALAIYREGKASWGTTAVVATSETFHDALSASSYAYAKRAPVFLANAQAHLLDDRVVSAIKSHGFDRVIVVGGPAALSTDIENQLSGIPCKRLYGATAYETSGAIAAWCVSEGGMTAAYPGVATGEGYWDALAGAALCGKNNSPIMLASDSNRSAINSFIRPNRSSVQSAFVFGGPAAVSGATYDAVVGAVLNPDPVSGERAVEPGTYRLALSANNAMTLEAAGGSTAEGANVQVYSANGTVAQTFELVWDANTSCYVIVNAKSFKVLDVASLSPLAGTNAVLRSSTNADSQRWAAFDNGDGTVTLVNRATGLALFAASASNGANAATAQRDSSASQKFKLVAADLIEDGFYAVQSQVANDRYLDVPYSSMDEGKQLQVYASNGNIAQKFVFKKVATNTYQIRSLVSGKLLADSGGRVVQTSSASNASHWMARYAEGGIAFVNKASGKAMAISGGSASLGAGLVTAAADGSAPQRFRVALTDPLPSQGNYTLAPACDTSKRLDLAGGSWSVGANVQSYANNGSNAQKWEITSLGGGQYRITSSLTWRDVEVAGGSAANGANVRVYSRNGGAAQRWRVQVTPDGWYTFVNVASGKALGVSGNSASNGANVASLHSDGAAGQKWRAIPASAASISGNAELDGYLRGTIHGLGNSPSLRAAFDWTSNREWINDAGPRYWGIMSDAQTIDRALYMYRNGYGDCYNYAATFMWLATALGYSANTRAGAVPGYSGQAAHGWVEIYSGGTYVCDPNLAHDYPSRNWYMVTYSSASTEYIL